MQYISNDYKTALADLMREPRAKVEHTNYTIYDSTDLIEIKISAAMVERLFGNTPSKAATLTIQNASNYEFELGDEFTIYVGLTLGGGGIEYIKQGIFILDNFELDEVNNKITLNLFDKMVKFNAKYNNDAFIFPKNIDGFIEDLAIAADVEIETNTDFTFDIVKPNVGENEFSLRDLLGWASELVGANSIINHDGKLVVKQYTSEPVVELTADDYDEYVVGDVSPLITGVILTHQPENDSVHFPDPLPEEGSIYKIINNAISYNNREAIAVHSYAAIAGSQFTEFTLNWRGNYALELGDKLFIYDLEENVLSVGYYNNFDFTFDGSTNELVYLEVLSQDEIDRRTSASVKDQKISAALMVDKINNRIQGLVSEVGEVDSRTSNLQITIDGLESDIEKVNDDMAEFANLKTTVEGIDLRIGKVGGDNLIKNSSGYYNTDWERTFNGNTTEEIGSFTNTEVQNNTISGRTLFPLAGHYEQHITVPEGDYIITFKTKGTDTHVGTMDVIVNGNIIPIDVLSEEWVEHEYLFKLNENTIVIEIEVSDAEIAHIADMMLLSGNLKQVWTPANGESVLGGVKIGRSIEITSGQSNVMQKIDNDGNRIINISTNETVAEYTDKGLETDDVQANSGTIAKLLFRDMGDQTWITRM